MGENELIFKNGVCVRFYILFSYRDLIRSYMNNELEVLRIQMLRKLIWKLFTFRIQNQVLFS